MKIGLVIVPLLLATSAYAQAPGDDSQAPADYQDGDIAPPGMAPPAPVVVTPAPPPRVRRWSLGLGLGSLSVAPHHAPDAGTEFSVGQLAVRYLATRHLELELAMSGGDESTDGYAGDREVHSMVLGARYRFQPQHRWNWWLMAGMGSFAVNSQSASDQERSDAVQSTLQFGLGIERRFNRFAIQLEGRAVGVKPNDEGDMATSVPVKSDDPNMQPPPPLYPTATRDGWAGGQITISGNFYF